MHDARAPRVRAWSVGRCSTAAASRRSSGSALRWLCAAA